MTPSGSALSAARLLEHRRISRRKERIDLQWGRILRTHTAAAAMASTRTVAATTKTTEFKASRHQRHLQLLVVSELATEERESPTEPQWGDYS